jgi:2,3-dihydroxyphenylpropionate 1,2-dioxygenase
LSEIVIGVAASHSTLMNTHWDQTVHRDRAEAYRDALYSACDAVRAAEPDVAVVIGSNHFRGLWLDLMPSFTLGVGEVNASGESGTPKGPLPVRPEFAQHLCDRLVADRFDLAFSGRLQVDHGISHAVQYLLEGVDAAVTPLIVNMFAPPLPRLSRCAELGHALGAAIGDAPGDLRVAVIASGGLSHALPWPDWRAPRSDDDHFMVTAWLDGRDNWADYDARRREIILAAEPRLNTSFDDDVLTWIEQGRMEQVIALEDRLEEVAGNGAHEIRSWLMMASACGHAPGRRLAYAPMPEWLTGMAVSVIPHPTPVTRPATRPATGSGSA